MRAGTGIANIASSKPTTTAILLFVSGEIFEIEQSQDYSDLDRARAAMGIPRKV